MLRPWGLREGGPNSGSLKWDGLKAPTGKKNMLKDLGSKKAVLVFVKDVDVYKQECKRAV